MKLPWVGKWSWRCAEGWYRKIIMQWEIDDLLTCSLSLCISTIKIFEMNKATLRQYFTISVKLWWTCALVLHWVNSNIFHARRFVSKGAIRKSFNFWTSQFVPWITTLAIGFYVGGGGQFKKDWRSICDEKNLLNCKIQLQISRHFSEPGSSSWSLSGSHRANHQRVEGGCRCFDVSVFQQP